MLTTYVVAWIKLGTWLGASVDYEALCINGR